MVSGTYRVVLIGRTFLSRQHLSMDIRNHRLGIRNFCLSIRNFRLSICNFHSGICNFRVGIRNHRLSIRDRHVSIEGQLRLKAGWSVHELPEKPTEHTVKI